MNNNNPLIDLVTARALVARGWSVVPTESDAEKRPKGRFATAKSWRDFSDRLPTDAELLGWFGPGPRRGGVVLHRGQLCVDRDTKDEMPDGSAPWEETDHGSHEFFLCATDAQIAHDHDAKIDYLTYGSFVRLANTRCLLDWQGELPEFSSEPSDSSKAGDSSEARTSSKSSPSSILELLRSQGWRVSAKAANGWFNLTNGTKTAAMSADGSVIKMFSTTCCERPADSAEPTPTPVVRSAAVIRGARPRGGLHFCRACALFLQDIRRAASRYAPPPTSSPPQARSSGNRSNTYGSISERLLASRRLPTRLARRVPRYHVSLKRNWVGRLARRYCDNA